MICPSCNKETKRLTENGVCIECEEKSKIDIKKSPETFTAVPPSSGTVEIVEIREKIEDGKIVKTVTVKTVPESELINSEYILSSDLQDYIQNFYKYLNKRRKFFG